MNRKLTVDELNYVQREVKLKGKKLSTSYVLALFFGFLGIHLGYLERTKAAVLRALLTVLIIVTYFPVKAAVVASETGGITTQLQQYSSTLFVAYVALVVLNISLMMYDLINLSSMVGKVNEKIEAKAGIKVIEANHVEGKIREDETSDRLVIKISEKLESEIESKSKMIEDEIAIIHKKIMDKNEITADLIENVNLKIKEFENISIDLDEKIQTSRNKFFEEIEALKVEAEGMRSEIKSHIKEIKDDLESEKSGQVRSEASYNKSFVGKVEEPIETFKSNLENTFKASSEISIENNEPKDIVESKSAVETSIKEEAPLEEKTPIEESVDKDNSVLLEEVKTDDVLEDEVVVEVDNFDNKACLTVNEAISKGEGVTSVSGFIVGYMSPVKHDITFNNFDGDLNVSIAEDPQEKDIEKMITVQLTWDSKLRERVGLLSNPGNLGKEITIVNGELGKYFSGIGLKQFYSVIFNESKVELISED